MILCAVGRLKAGPERELFDRYATRSKSLSRTAGLTGFDVAEVDESHARSGPDRKREEASAIGRRLGAATRTIVFDERGRSFTSRDFVDLIGRARQDGDGALALVVGGPDGIEAAFAERASAALAFGAATLPHQLAQVLVAEQVYRALTIMTGHPYHRA